MTVRLSKQAHVFGAQIESRTGALPGRVRQVLARLAASGRKLTLPEVRAAILNALPGGRSAQQIKKWLAHAEKQALSYHPDGTKAGFINHLVTIRDSAHTGTGSSARGTGSPATVTSLTGIDDAAATANSKAVAPLKGLKLDGNPAIYAAIPAFTCGQHAVGRMKMALLSPYTKEQRTLGVDIRYASEDGQIIKGENVIYYDEDSRCMMWIRMRMKDIGRQGSSLPSFINDPSVPAVVDGAGVPTSLYTTIGLMKAAGVPYGGLKTLILSQIDNVRTGLELLRQPEIMAYLREHPDATDFPQALIEQHILNTNTGRSLRTLAAFTGHKLDKVTVRCRSAGTTDPLWYHLRPSQQADPRMKELFACVDPPRFPNRAAPESEGEIAWYRAWAERESLLDPKTPFPAHFDVIAEVSPQD